MCLVSFPVFLIGAVMTGIGAAVGIPPMLYIGVFLLVVSVVLCVTAFCMAKYRQYTATKAKAAVAATTVGQLDTEAAAGAPVVAEAVPAANVPLDQQYPAPPQAPDTPVQAAQPVPSDEATTLSGPAYPPPSAGVARDPSSEPVYPAAAAYPPEESVPSAPQDAAHPPAEQPVYPQGAVAPETTSDPPASEHPDTTLPSYEDMTKET